MKVTMEFLEEKWLDKLEEDLEPEFAQIFDRIVQQLKEKKEQQILATVAERKELKSPAEGADGEYEDSDEEDYPLQCNGPHTTTEVHALCLPCAP